MCPVPIHARWLQPRHRGCHLTQQDQAAPAPTEPLLRGPRPPGAPRQAPYTLAIIKGLSQPSSPRRLVCDPHSADLDTEASIKVGAGPEPGPQGGAATAQTPAAPRGAGGLGRVGACPGSSPWGRGDRGRLPRQGSRHSLICRLPAPHPSHGLITQSLAVVWSSPRAVSRALFPALSPITPARSLAQRDSSSRPKQSCWRTGSD